MSIYRCLIVDIIFYRSVFLEVFRILTFFHVVGIRLSDKHLSVFEMLSSPTFNVSMCLWSLSVAVLLFIYHSAASASHDVIPGTYFGSVWIMVLCSLSYSSV